MVLPGGASRVSVDVPPVAHLDDEDDEFTVVDLVGDPVASGPEPPADGRGLPLFIAWPVV